jgi:hypothetical protein
MRGKYLVLLLVSAATVAHAGEKQRPVRHFSEQEVGALAAPTLAFQETPQNVQDYDKYFYFHRPDTSFDEAFSDISECDALASGFTYYGGASDYSAAMVQYGVAAGALGGLLGSAIADAIFGSAERRKERRINLRNCMHYKAYDRYGLDKDLWQEFNFEEGNQRVEGEERQHYLMLQARVASGPRPDQKAIEP